mmetsp:Transcript_37822/g.91724  ORF Transcript_37822/g.91724 Transcript_37822/m.91724 type:complete len:95 (+) Transcript_37822:13-297(+)
MKRGNLEKSVEHYENMIEILHEEVGTLHPQTASAYCSISTVYMLMGMLEEAVAISAKGLKIRRRLLGDDHPDTQRHMVEHRLRLQLLLLGNHQS